ncbi:MAG: hypothetical protein COB35_04805 [Gammaproteobacteria bacterium]|nr:MAG: hypothetical protein COB35_04805 [Gammaproteobacteria bacterium]
MRVSTFSRLSAIAIGIFIILFIGTMYQISTTLTKSKIQLANYQQLKSLATIDFYRTIAIYLQHGDASLLNKAEHQLDRIINITARIGIKSFEQNLNIQVIQLKRDLKQKFRAMGKLSGDPYILIKNNEQGLISLNTELQNYAQNSTELASKEQKVYLNITQNIAKQYFTPENTYFQLNP